MSRDVHPTAVITDDVDLGDDVRIGPYAVLIGPGSLGDGCYVGAHAVIGAPGEIQGTPHPPGWSTGSGGTFFIGDNTIIREHATVHVTHGTRTVIGQRCYIMVKSYVPHHARLGDGVTVASMSVIGGHGVIGDHAWIGFNSVIHQRRAIGEGVIVGMGSLVTRDVPPFAKAYGSPARIHGANTVGLERLGFERAIIDRLQAGYVDGEDPEALLSELGDPRTSSALESWERAKIQALS